MVFIVHIEAPPFSGQLSVTVMKHTKAIPSLLFHFSSLSGSEAFYGANCASRLRYHSVFSRPFRTPTIISSPFESLLGSRSVRNTLLYHAHVYVTTSHRRLADSEEVIVDEVDLIDENWDDDDDEVEVRTDVNEDEDDDDLDEDDDDEAIVGNPANSIKVLKPSEEKQPKSKDKKPAIKRIDIVIREEDLEEKFVRGGGPGGQSVNKTSNRVQLVHKPTGIAVSCQETRDRVANRKIARTRLKEKLDLMLNGEESKLAKRQKRLQRRKSKADQRAKKKYHNDDLDEVKVDRDE